MREHMEGKLLLAACEEAVRIGSGLADETACCLLGRTHSLVRFGTNRVTQNVQVREIRLVVRVVRDGRLGMASVGSLDDASVRMAVEKAVEMSTFAEPDPAAGFADPEEISQVSGFDEETERITPEQLAGAVQRIVEPALDRGLEAAGACQAVAEDRTVVSSRGVRLYGRKTEAKIHTVIMSDTSSGYAEDCGTAFSSLRPGEAALNAIGKCEAGRNPRPVEPGTWTVVLEPKAVADLVQFFSAFAFNPVSWHEGQSPLSGKMGRRLFPECVTLEEDPLTAEGLPFPFDWDGRARRKVALIKRGTVAGMVYDELTARKYGQTSTGSAPFPVREVPGLFPGNLSMLPGGQTTDELIRQVKKGILVTRFHYLGIMHPREGLVTGMTRDGTFLIENGQITGAVKNLRMTDSVVSILQKTAAVSRERKLVRDWVGHVSMLAPALLVEGVRFNGTADH